MMDYSAIGALQAVGVHGGSAVTKSALDGTGTLTGTLGTKTQKAEGTLFDSFLNSAIDNIKTTNSLLSDMEDEEIRFAVGEVDNTHDLSIAIQKASTALQYTVAVKNKLLEAYKEIMQIQI